MYFCTECASALHIITSTKFVNPNDTELFITNHSMLMLLEDFEEFKSLVPQAGLRVKIKDLIQNVKYHHKKIIAIIYIYMCACTYVCMCIYSHYYVH